MTPSELMQYLLFSAMLFVLGLFGALTRRNTVIVLLSIELMLNAANINLVALSRFLPGGAENARLPHPSLAGDFSATLGQTVALFTIAVAAAEVAVGLAALIAFYRLKASPNVDEMDSLKR
ncbi:MAG: NADH-quinone oxidoreductase subunit NuoK [Hydrogenibacillus sp.]|nr:NADH-quinone oxidoreductase subunit NuoK [Hydrogenibacillus sp.]